MGYYPERLIIKSPLDTCVKPRHCLRLPNAEISIDELRKYFPDPDIVVYKSYEDIPSTACSGSVFTDGEWVYIFGCNFVHKLGLTNKYECINPNLPPFCKNKVRIG